MFYLIASSLGHLRSHCRFRLSAATFYKGDTVGLRWGREGVWPARNRTRRTASARLLMIMQPAIHLRFPRVCWLCGFIRVLRMIDLADAKEVGLGRSLVAVSAAVSVSSLPGIPLCPGIHRRGVGLLLLLLLFRQSEKSLIYSIRAPCYFTQLTASPHAIIPHLHAHRFDFVTIIPQT